MAPSKLRTRVIQDTRPVLTSVYWHLSSLPSAHVFVLLSVPARYHGG
jgi:hypothetical protein